MDDRGTWKVGLIAILAGLGVLVAMAFLVPSINQKLTGGRWHFYIIFDDVNGLQTAEKVQLVGVPIGTVTRVELVAHPDSPAAEMVASYFAAHHLPPHSLPFALVEVAIERDYQGELFKYYNYEVQSTSLIGTNHEVAVTPAAPPDNVSPEEEVMMPGDIVNGQANGGIAQSVAQLAKPAGKLMASATDLTQKLQDLIGDPRLKQDMLTSLDQVRIASSNMRQISEQAKVLSTNASVALNKSLPDVQVAMGNLKASSANIRTASAQAPVMVSQLHGTLTRVSGNLVDISEHARTNINATTDKLRSFVSESGTLGDLHDTVANFKAGSEQLTGILTDVHGLTQDNAIQQDLPQMMQNLNAASAKLAPALDQMKSTLGTYQQLGQNANGLIGGVRGILPGSHPAPAGAPRAIPPASQSIGIHEGIGFLYSNKTSEVFNHRGIVDPEARLTLGANSLYLGIYDIGGGNHITAELGRRLLGTESSGVTFRYGLYRGLAGLGSDLILNPRIGFYATVYNPNAPSIDLESLLDITPNFGLWTGLDEINRDPRFVAGMRVKIK